MPVPQARPSENCRDGWPAVTDEPFATIDELASCLEPDGWILIGGLMVHAHALLADLTHHRATDDADVVVGLTVVTYATAVVVIEAIGFERVDSLNLDVPTYRWVRGRDQIDLMAPDRQAPPVRHGRRDVLAVPGSSSAMRNTERFELSSGLIVRVPDVTAALSLKGAAAETASGRPIRHAQDAVMLLACAAERGARVPVQVGAREHQQGAGALGAPGSVERCIATGPALGRRRDPRALSGGLAGACVHPRVARWPSLNGHKAPVLRRYSTSPAFSWTKTSGSAFQASKSASSRAR